MFYISWEKIMCGKRKGRKKMACFISIAKDQFVSKGWRSVPQKGKTKWGELCWWAYWTASSSILSKETLQKKIPSKILVGGHQVVALRL